MATPRIKDDKRDQVTTVDKRRAESGCRLDREEQRTRQAWTFENAESRLR
jgi:hypothetical protein